MKNIADILREIVGRGASVSSLICTVDKVDGRMCDVSPVDTDLAPLTEVRLNAMTDGEAGIVITPKVGSFVLVSLLTENDAFVTMFSEIDSIVLDGGENGGLTITPELKTQLDKMTARIDGIMDAIKNAVPGSMDGGLALHASMMAALATIVQKEDFSNIENEKIKH